MKTDTTVELVEMLFKLSRIMKGEMSFTHNLTHLSVLQIQTLIFLKKNENVTMSNIAENFHIELPSATSLLNKLCDQKLVRRYEDPDDRRLVKVALTAQGAELMEQAMRERRKKLEKILTYLSGKEKAELLKIFTTLYSKLHT